MRKWGQVLQLYCSKWCYEIHYSHWQICNSTLGFNTSASPKIWTCDTRTFLLVWAEWGLGTRLYSNISRGHNFHMWSVPAAFKPCWRMQKPKKAHVEAITSIYGQRRLRSNPADVCKSPRKAHNVTRFSVAYIRLGTRLGVIGPNPCPETWSYQIQWNHRAVFIEINAEATNWTNVEARTSTSIVLLKVMLWNSLLTLTNW